MLPILQRADRTSGAGLESRGVRTQVQGQILLLQDGCCSLSHNSASVSTSAELKPLVGHWKVVPLAKQAKEAGPQAARLWVTHMVGRDPTSLCGRGVGGRWSSLLVFFQDLRTHPCEDSFLPAESGLLRPLLTGLKMKTSDEDTSKANTRVIAEDNCVRNQTI